MPTANELRELKVDELGERSRELKKQLFEMRSKHNTGVLDSPAEIQRARRDIARVLTVAREAQLGLVRRAKSEKKAAPRPQAEAKAEPKAKKAAKAKE